MNDYQVGAFRISNEATPFLMRLAQSMPQEFEKSLRSVGWWLKGEIQKDISAGVPGGRPYSSFSNLRVSGRSRGSSKFKRKYRTFRHDGLMYVQGSMRNRQKGKPLGRLGPAVRYKWYGDSRRVIIGWLNKSTEALGSTHEEGDTYTVTPRMRRFLWANAIPIAKSTSTVVIPRRPTIGPEYQQRAGAIPAYIEQKIWDNIRGMKTK